MKMPRLVQERLIERAKHGDDRAMQRLYEECADVVFARVKRLCGDADLAADLSQDSWIRAFEKLDRFDGRSTFCGWVYALATNLTIDHLRRENILKIEDVDLDSAGIAVSGPPPDLAIERIVIERCLELLPAGYRTVLILRVLDDLPHDEIAAKLGIEGVTSRSQFHKARARMLDCLRRAA